jgi:hypothetical protein
MTIVFVLTMQRIKYPLKNIMIMRSLTGIVSRDWGGLLMVLLD